MTKSERIAKQASKNVTVTPVNEYYDNIDSLVKSIMTEYAAFNPKCSYEYGDNRLNSYFISMAPNVYIHIFGSFGDFERLTIYKANAPKFDLMTDDGLDKFANEYGYDSNKYMCENCEILFKIDLRSDYNIRGNNDAIKALRVAFSGIIKTQLTY